MKQEYLGKEDYQKYFEYLLPMFLDDRYIKVEDMPLFYIFDPEQIPDIEVFIEVFNRLAKMNGLKGIYFVGRMDPMPRLKVINDSDYLDKAKERYQSLLDKGYSAINSCSFKRAEILSEGIIKKYIKKLKTKVFGYCMNDYDYLKMTQNYYMEEDRLSYVFPQLTPRKDKTPRAGKNAWLYKNSTPENFRVACKLAIDYVKDKDYDHRIIFLNSWNEWGEGSYMEPDLLWGHQYLDVLKDELKEE